MMNCYSAAKHKGSSEGQGSRKATNGRLYRLDSEGFDDTSLSERLLRRVDTIPVALALAQAAVESVG